MKAKAASKKQAAKSAKSKAVGASSKPKKQLAAAKAAPKKRRLRTIKDSAKTGTITREQARAAVKAVMIELGLARPGKE